MQQRPNRSRPAAGAPRRSAPGDSMPRQRRRPMTPREYEMLRRQRQRQNIKYLAMLGAFAVVLIIAVALILKPRPNRDASMQTAAMVTAAPQAAATAQAGGVNLDDPREGSASADTSADAVGAETATPVETPLPTVTAVPMPRPGGLRSARMRVVGDVMVCESQLKAYKSSGYDFHPEFDYIKDALSNADYTMANMEGTVGKYNKSPYSGYPQFNCPETILTALKDSGVDFLTLANNHMLDRFFDGLKNTVTNVEKAGFDYVGAYRTKKERQTPKVCEVNGIKIGFVAYTHSTNSIERLAKGLDPGATEYGVPYIQKADIAGDIQKLREAGAEVVIAFPHWGEEYVREPGSSQMKYAKKLAEAGADIILGSHSHMVQPMMSRSFTDSTGRTRDVFAIFSLGNFLSDHVLQYTDCGVILEFTISENSDGSFSCGDVGYIPTYCWQPTEGDVRILPSGKYLREGPVGMTEEAHARLVQSYSEITEVLGSDYPVLEG